MELTRATNAGEFIIPEHGPGIRCHEIAHAIGDIVKLPVQDGWVGIISGTSRGIEHSWLWTTPFPLRGSAEEIGAWKGNILDPWVMGGFPQTQLVACRPIFFQLGIRYRPSFTPRDDVDPTLVNTLKQFFRAYMERTYVRTQQTEP